MEFLLLFCHPRKSKQSNFAALSAGDWGITRTPKGLVIIGEGGWGSLRNSLNVGFQMLLHAQYAAADVRAACIAWAQSQADYALGSG